MGIEEIVEAFVAEGATSEMLSDFADYLGMRQHPFIGLVLDHLVMMEGLGSPLSPSYCEEFVEEELGEILATLGSPELPTSTDLSQQSSPVMVEATIPFEDVITPRPAVAERGRAFTSGVCSSRFRKFAHLAIHRVAEHPEQQEVDATASYPSVIPMDVSPPPSPYMVVAADPTPEVIPMDVSPPPSPKMVVAAVTMDDSPTIQSLPDDDEYSAWSPSTDEIIKDFADGFEPWSPLAVAAAVRMTDEGQSKKSGGKTFACGRCAAKFRKFDDLANHKASVHAPQKKMDPQCQSGFGDPQPGPSDTSSQRDDEQPDASGSSASGDPYEIVLSGKKTFSKSAAVESTYKVNFDDQWRGRKLGDLQDEMGAMFDNVLDIARQDMDDGDLMRVIIRHEELDHAIVVPLRPANKMDASAIMEKVANVLQSEEDLALDESFRVIIGAIHIPKGTGWKRITELTGPHNSIHDKTSMVEIVNADSTCMARAIGVCFANLCVVPRDEWRQLKETTDKSSNVQILMNR